MSATDSMTPKFVIELGIGWMQWPDGKRQTPMPFEYMREIERLRASLLRIRDKSVSFISKDGIEITKIAKDALEEPRG